MSTQPSQERRSVKIARESFLWAGAVLGALSVVLVLLAIVFDIKPLVFRSGSMEPAISTGALAWAKEMPAADVEPGDVVSVVAKSGTRVTHRVVTVGGTGEEVILTLKGDANQSPDPEAYSVSTVDEVVLDIPKAGYLLAALGSPVGMFACGLLVAAALFFGFGRREASGIGTHVRSAIVAAGLVGLLLPMARPGDTVAFFTDSATMTTGVLGSGNVPAGPTTLVCSGGGFLVSTITQTWTHTSAALDYRVTVRTGSTVGTGTLVSQDFITGPTTIPPSTISRTLTNRGGLGLGSYSLNIVVEARRKGSVNWYASTVASDVFREGYVIGGTSIYCD